MTTSTRAYFDWNATAPLRPEARSAVLRALEGTGNASSVHGEGRTARALIERARIAVAELVGAEARNVTFTSGGSEANTLALNGAHGRVLVSAIEHPSILTARADRIPVTARGVIDLDALRAQLAGKPALVSIMLVNNETGIIQPIRAAADIVHAAGGLLHVDAVQAAGRIAIDLDELGADLLTISSHKIGGPQGAGALITRGDVRVTPLIVGGGQERSRRAGTENVAAIAGFGEAAKAARAALAKDVQRMRALREKIETRLRASSPDLVIFGEGEERIPNTVLFAVPGIKAETAIIAFDLEGVAVSSGSACSSGKVAPSHVLAAMGVSSATASGAIRVSFGPETGELEVEMLMNAWKKVLSSLSKSQSNNKREIAA